jgi:hypothetical protein
MTKQEAGPLRQGPAPETNDTALSLADEATAIAAARADRLELWTRLGLTRPKLSPEETRRVALWCSMLDRHARGGAA